jgi:hypothetical protein
MTLALAAMLFPSWAMTTATPAHAEDFNLKRAGIFIQKEDCQKAWEVLRGKVKADPESAYAFASWMFGNRFAVYPLMNREENHLRLFVSATITSESLMQPEFMGLADAALYKVLPKHYQDEFLRCFEQEKNCRSEMFEKFYGRSAKADFEGMLLLMSTPGNYGVCLPTKWKNRKAPYRTLAEIAKDWSGYRRYLRE